ncbi:MAG: penicillin-binding protein 2 [Anaerolineales bacterium]|nr:MAG: penicillin-binding protein 2 [Anaerolineales bacterium]
MSIEAREGHSGRLRILQIVLAAITLLLAVRLLELQVLQADGYDGSKTPLPDETKRAPRGRIVEKRGYLLATDVFQWEVGANPQTFGDEDSRWRAAICLQDVLNVPANEVFALLKEETSYVVIRREVPRNLAQMINGASDNEQTSPDEAIPPSQPRPKRGQPLEEDSEVMARVTGLCDWPLTDQVWASPYRVRLYPQNELFAHLTGFVTIDDGDSYYGLEEIYGAFLQGEVSPELRRSGEGTLPEDFSIFLPSEVGYDLILTVDWRIQRIVEKALAEAVQETGAEGGTIIVMEPQTGAILASTSHPAYDPNEYWKYPNSTPLFSDPAISDIYEPGSVFKIITLAIAIDSGAITPDSVFNDPGKLEVAGHVFQNADHQAHGQVTATEILALSLNVGIAHVGEQIGTDTFYRYLPRFGFDGKTGVDLAHDARGLVKSPGDSDWSQSDFVANSFGQGIGVTPLQMVSAVAAIANNGMLMRPHVADKLVVSGQVVKVQPTLVDRVIKPETARTLTKMMVTAVEIGAPEALIPECDVAGKTGTAQVPVEGGYHEEWTIASFVGFAPAVDPAFACLIKLDKPQTSIWGAYVAAPVFQEIAPQILRILKVPPDVQRPGSE